MGQESGETALSNTRSPASSARRPAGCCSRLCSRSAVRRLCGRGRGGAVAAEELSVRVPEREAVGDSCVRPLVGHDERDSPLGPVAAEVRPVGSAVVGLAHVVVGGDYEQDVRLVGGSGDRAAAGRNAEPGVRLQVTPPSVERRWPSSPQMSTRPPLWATTSRRWSPSWPGSGRRTSTSRRSRYSSQRRSSSRCRRSGWRRARLRCRTPKARP